MGWQKRQELRGRCTTFEKRFSAAGKAHGKPRMPLCAAAQNKRICVTGRLLSGAHSHIAYHPVTPNEISNPRLTAMGRSFTFERPIIRP